MAKTGGVRSFILKEGCSFLKKRTKKLLSVNAVAGRSPAAPEQKSFASFLQKRRLTAL
jgi:hypothetical protein